MTETPKTVTCMEVEFKPGVHLWLGTQCSPWRVLDVDREAETALLIAEKTVCEECYHELLTDITWEHCSLRKWLNGEYYENTFSEEERAAILECKLRNPDNPAYGTKGGNDTRDRIFLFSIEEAKKYFKKDRDSATGTWWWLRSPGCLSKGAACVVDDGGIGNLGHLVHFRIGVRPAMKINLKSDIFQSFISSQSSESIIIKVPELSLKSGILLGALPNVEDVTIPDGVIIIGEYAFSGYRGLKSAMIPDSVTSIGKRAFSGCSRLKSVMIPDSVTIIGEYAFSECRCLESIAIPESVTDLGEGAFKLCKNLSRIVSGVKLPDDCFDSDYNGPVFTNDPGNLPEWMKPLAAISFAENPDDLTSERGKKHLEYIKGNAAELKVEAFTHPMLLRLMCENKLLTPEITDLYLDAASETGNAEIIAELLDYKQNKLTEEEKAQAAQRAETLEEEVSCSDLCK